MKQNYMSQQIKIQNQPIKWSANCKTQSPTIGINPAQNLVNIFLAQNKEKAPPGQAYHSGIGYCLFPGHPPDEVISQTTDEALLNRIHTEYKTFNKNQNSNYYKHLIFKIMKKQILLLVFFVLAGLAGITTAFAQPQDHLTTALSTCPGVTAVTCLTNDAIHPVPGTAYDYTVTVPTPTGTQEFNWFVTQDQTFVTNSVIVAAAEANTGTGAHIAATGTGYNDPASGAATINITWKSFTHDPALPVFLVIYVQNTATCSNDNMQVYIIQPVNSFTLDLANLGLDGVTHTGLWDGPCAAPVKSATYDVGTGTVLMNYGINYLYFAVTAANYTGAWKPSFQISGDGITGTAGDRTVVAVDWTYPATSTSTTASDWNPTTLTTTDYIADDVVLAQAANKTVGVGGECIVVRVTVDNGRLETLTPEAITFAVDGTTMTESTAGSGTYDTPGFGDIHWDADGTGTCPWYDGFTNDVTTQNIMPRPDVQDATTPPAGNDFIPKN